MLNTASPQSLGPQGAYTNHIRSGGAAEYANRYLRITSPEYTFDPATGHFESGFSIATPVAEYLNRRFENRAGVAPCVRLAFKDHLLFQFLGSRDGVTTRFPGITRRSGMIDVKDSGGTPMFSVSSFDVATSFFGKATPEALSRTIKLLSLWRAFHRARNESQVKVGWKVDENNNGRFEHHEHHSRRLTVAELPQLVSMFLGVDCNGFTGNYLLANYPELVGTTKTIGEGTAKERERKIGLWPDTEEETYVSSAKKKGLLRKSIVEIQDDDVLAFSTDGRSYHHVAMVNRKLIGTATQCVLSIAESRSAHAGGPQVNTFRITMKVRDTANRRNLVGHFEVTESEFEIPGREAGGSAHVRVLDPPRFEVAGVMKLQE